jgi:poly(glycerol-phosphate) alpha-glucosyltransferase
MALLEAWYYRLPVLMTKQCSLPEVIAADAAKRIGTDFDSIVEGLRSLIASRFPALSQVRLGSGLQKDALS